MLLLLFQNRGIGPTIDGELDCTISNEPALTCKVGCNEEYDRMLVLRPSSDNDIIIDELTLESTDEYLNNASVACTLRDSALSAVSGGTCSCTYVTSSDGQYRGTLVHSVSLTDGSLYYLDVTAAKDDANVFIRKPCIASYYQGE